MKLIDKLFPHPEPGAERIIPSRHPVQIGLILGMLASSFFQLISGPVTGSLGVATPWAIWLMMIVASVTGCAMVLTAAVIAESKPWDAMGFSLGGFFIVSLVLLISCYGYYVGYPGEWFAKRDFWINLFIAFGFWWRFSQLCRRSVGLWISHREM